MKKTLTFLVATTALTTAVVVPAWSAIADADIHSVLTDRHIQSDAQVMPLILASDDDDHRRHKGTRRDDDEEEDEDDDDDCDDDKHCNGVARNPAPVGTITPPKNGLFGNATAPKVQMK